ncbi:MAG: acetylxylan esterase [Planctomycetota bacterium]
MFLHRFKPALVLLWIVAALPGSLHADELRCLTPEETAAAALYPQLQAKALLACDQRDAAYAALKTADDVKQWVQERRHFFLEQLGPLPPRSPLNARTVRTIDADGYRIECVIFDSQPGHRITANLYLPSAAAPVPAVVVSSGHSRTAKTADYNQRFALQMVRLGMAALCFDPIGQGERSQILNEQHHPEHEGTTTEHFLVGVGSILVGRNTATYRLHDAMRAVDYVCSRAEIDPTRIGFTGCSGGGTMTSYVMALDDRITCAAPACYITTFRRLIETIGPQDAEQNLFGQVAFGLDHPDYLLLRAPKPTLISSTTQDFFDINGSWQAFRQAKRVWGILGHPERVDLVEMAGSHGVQPQNLATIGHWFQRWLLQLDRPTAIEPFAVRTDEELRCTEQGQVLLLPDEKSVFDLNAALAAQLQQHRLEKFAARTPEELQQTIRSVLKLRAAADRKPPVMEDRGRVSRPHYHIDRLVLKTDQGHLIPGLTWHPPVPSDDACLYLHDAGKTGAAQPDGALEKLVHQGFAVVSVDLRNQGELQAAKPNPLLTDWKTFSLAYLLGDSLLAHRVEDVLNAADFVAFYQKPREKPRQVHLIAEGQSGIAALHAAALQPDLFASVTLKNTPRDWTSIAGSSSPAGQLESTVHGVLRDWDLPDLEAIVPQLKRGP